MSIPQRTMPGEARPVQWLCAGLGLSLIRRSCSLARIEPYRCAPMAGGRATHSHAPRLRWGGSCLRGGRVDEVEF